MVLSPTHTDRDWLRYLCTARLVQKERVRNYSCGFALSQMRVPVDTRLGGVVSLDKAGDQTKAASEILVKHR